MTNSARPCVMCRDEKAAKPYLPLPVYGYEPTVWLCNACVREARDNGAHYAPVVTIVNSSNRA